MIVKTTAHVSNEETKMINRFQITMKLATILSTKIIQSRMLVPTNDIIENTPCTFQGNMPDPDDCQCKLLSNKTFILL